MSDLIDRQAAIDAIKRCESAYSYDINNGLILAMNAVADVPIIEERKNGKWLYSDAFPHWVYCNQCFKRLVPNKEWIELYNIPVNFCPNCGADMRGGSDGE